MEVGGWNLPAVRHGMEVGRWEMEFGICPDCYRDWNLNNYQFKKITFYSYYDFKINTE
jgi:hypothetical protein